MRRERLPGVGLPTSGSHGAGLAVAEASGLTFHLSLASVTKAGSMGSEGLLLLKSLSTALLVCSADGAGGIEQSVRGGRWEEEGRQGRWKAACQCERSAPCTRPTRWLQSRARGTGTKSTSVPGARAELRLREAGEAGARGGQVRKTGGERRQCERRRWAAKRRRAATAHMCEIRGRDAKGGRGRGCGAEARRGGERGRVRPLQPGALSQRAAGSHDRSGTGDGRSGRRERSSGTGAVSRLSGPRRRPAPGVMECK